MCETNCDTTGAEEVEYDDCDGDGGDGNGSGYGSICIGSFCTDGNSAGMGVVCGRGDRSGNRVEVGMGRNCEAARLF